MRRSTRRARRVGTSIRRSSLEPDDLPWIVPEKTKIAQGDVAVLGGWEMLGFARLLKTIEHDTEEGTANITFEPPTGLGSPMAQTFLYAEPEGVRLGLPETAGAQLVIKAPGATQLTVNGVVEVVFNSDANSMLATVASVSGDELVLSVPNTASGPVKVEAFSALAPNADGKFETPHGIQPLCISPIPRRPVLFSFNRVSKSAGRTVIRATRSRTPSTSPPARPATRSPRSPAARSSMAMSSARRASTLLFSAGPFASPASRRRG